MKILDFLKKKKKTLKKKPVKKEKKEKVGVGLPPVRKEEIGSVTKKKKEVSERVYRVLYSPYITEKATMLGEENKYVFKVWPKTNKIEIKKAIKDLYGVEAIAVKIINIPRKERRLGRQKGWKKGYKKAIIKIKEGQKIEILPR